MFKNIKTIFINCIAYQMLTTKLLSLNTEINRMKLKHIFWTFLFSSFCIIMQGQTLDNAKAMFNESKFADALPFFRIEYNITPDNANLNYWLGVSLFETGLLTESEKYLAFASKNNIRNSYIYLGELYAKMYRFADAEREFSKYEKANRRDKEALAKLTNKREYMSKLKQSISHTEDIQIIDSLVVYKQDFLNAYNLSSAAGKVVPSNKFFKNNPETDKTVYINELENKIYYSQQGKLFTMEKLIDTYGNEKLLPETINDKGIQDFPFVMPDGATIYFASTSEESMGGYDIYVTRYNIQTNSYLNPNRLNAPFNSPFNDYMMVIDEEKGIGWFASDRFQPSDSVCVYTFIPNNQTTMLENESQEYLIKLPSMDLPSIIVLFTIILPIGFSRDMLTPLSPTFILSKSLLSTLSSILVFNPIFCSDLDLTNQIKDIANTANDEIKAIVPAVLPKNIYAYTTAPTIRAPPVMPAMLMPGKRNISININIMPITASTITIVIFNVILLYVDLKR